MTVQLLKNGFHTQYIMTKSWRCHCDWMWCTEPI